MPMFTTAGGGASSAAKEKARQEKARQASLERRRKRDATWLEKQVGKVGRGEALKDIDQHWQSYTPFEMSLLLSADEVAQAVEARIMRVAAIFESARNMLIIVPIMLTWLSLALAAAAYEGNLSAAAPNGKPFLQQWQEGFAPLASIHLLRWNISLLSHGGRWFTFANFALTDAALLCIILALTILGQALEIVAYRRSTRVAEALEQRLYTLNSQTLLGSLAAGPDAKMPPWLRELRADLGLLREVIDKMNDALVDSMARYNDAIVHQEEAVSALVTDTNRVHDSVVQLNALYQGGAEAARVYQRYIPTLTQNITTMARSQQHAMDSMETQVDMLARSMRYLGELTGHAREAQRSINRHYRQGGSQGGQTTGRSPAYRPPATPAPDEWACAWPEDGDARADMRADMRANRYDAEREMDQRSADAHTDWPPSGAEPDGAYGAYPADAGGWERYADDGAAPPRLGFWGRLGHRLRSILALRAINRWRR